MINRENIQAKLIADIDIIVQGILQNMSQKPIAIYLCGGIGRDEGSWYMDNNGIVCPYNDYDVAVISEYDIEYEQLQDLRKELAKQQTYSLGRYRFLFTEIVIVFKTYHS